jgi:LPS sulfotransferase NodH
MKSEIVQIRYRVTMVFDLGSFGMMGGRIQRTVSRTVKNPSALMRRVERDGLRIRQSKHEVLYIAPHRLISSRAKEVA